MNKKGDMNFFMMLMAASILFFLLWVFVFKPVFFSSSEEFGKDLLDLKLRACKAKFDRGRIDGSSYPDKDGDGLGDDCDNCPDTPNFDEAIVTDEDGDGFPALINEKSTQWKVCCIEKEEGEEADKEKECETQDNDKVYGPKSLILAYIKPKTS